MRHTWEGVTGPMSLVRPMMLGEGDVGLISSFKKYILCKNFFSVMWESLSLTHMSD